MKLYQTDQVNGSAADKDINTQDEIDIEAEINRELADIRKPSRMPLFTSVKLDTQCCRSAHSSETATADAVWSDVLPYVFASGAGVLHRDNLSRLNVWRAATELSLREAIDPNHGNREGEHERP